jgi:hypothetical protein
VGLSLFTVAEDTPAALVLENRGSRYFAGASVLAVGGMVAFSPLGRQEMHLGASDVTLPAQLLLGALLLWGVVGALDRQRIVLDGARGTVESSPPAIPRRLPPRGEPRRRRVHPGPGGAYREAPPPTVTSQ